MPPALCIVCYEHVPFERLRFTACGHGFCEPCAKQLESRKERCPNCRKVIGKYGYRAIYGLEFAEPTPATLQRYERIQSAIAGLNEIDSRSSSESVELASRNMYRLLQSGNLNDEIAEMLMHAVSMLEDRLMPLVWENNNQCVEIARLKVELKKYQELQRPSRLSRLQARILSVGAALIDLLRRLLGVTITAVAAICIVAIRIGYALGRILARIALTVTAVLVIITMGATAAICIAVIRICDASDPQLVDQGAAFPTSLSW